MRGPLRVFLGFCVAVNEKNRSSVNLRIYMYMIFLGFPFPISKTTIYIKAERKIF